MEELRLKLIIGRGKSGFKSRFGAQEWRKRVRRTGRLARREVSPLKGTGKKTREVKKFL